MLYGVPHSMRRKVSKVNDTDLQFEHHPYRISDHVRHTLGDHAWSSGTEGTSNFANADSRTVFHERVHPGKSSKKGSRHSASGTMSASKIAISDLPRIFRLESHWHPTGDHRFPKVAERPTRQLGKISPCRISAVQTKLFKFSESVTTTPLAAPVSDGAEHHRFCNSDFDSFFDPRQPRSRAKGREIPNFAGNFLSRRQSRRDLARQFPRGIFQRVATRRHGRSQQDEKKQEGAAGEVGSISACHRCAAPGHAR